jgi:glutamyl-tRNA reductase
MTQMKSIMVVGVNHKYAPVEVRGRLAFGPERIPAALHKLITMLEAACPCRAPQVQTEAAILSTCNRTEVYVRAAGAASVERAVCGFLSESGQLPVEVLKPTLYTYDGDAAARHLMRVAAGLESLVVGENEILGQVKDAFEIAHAAETTGPILSTLFRYAVQVGKQVRNETDIGHAALSVATIVVELAEEMFGSLADRTALLIGAGKMSTLTARALVKAGLRCVLVANRTFERARKLAQGLGGRAVRFDALIENLIQADMVICSTGAPHIVLHVEDVQKALTGRPDRPLLVVDLAVPCDADPAIGELTGARLSNIDNLEALVQANHPLAVAVRQSAEAIVNAELDDFKAWYDARLSVPVIRALRARADAICQAELERTLGRLGDLTPHQQRAIEAMGHAIVSKLLHEPIVHLKNPPLGTSRPECLDLTQRLFGLN